MFEKTKLNEKEAGDGPFKIPFKVRAHKADSHELCLTRAAAEKGACKK